MASASNSSDFNPVPAPLLIGNGIEENSSSSAAANNSQPATLDSGASNTEKTELLQPSLVERARRHSSGTKTPDKCPICLGIPDDRSFTDTCYHEFCFVCLLEWSKVKSECPLCKQKFKNIIHNIRAANDYDTYALPTETAVFGIDDAGRRFRYPTTMTVERVELLRYIRELELRRQELERNNHQLERNNRRYVTELARLRRLRHLFERSGERREHLTGTLEFRRLVYDRRLRSIAPAPGEPVRQCSPKFIRRNPAMVNRLLPWLDRELTVLMKGIRGRVDFLMNIIRYMITQHSIDSPEFRHGLHPYLQEETDAFLYEFHNFARSPYDMEEYDRRVQYESWRDARARLRAPGEAPPEYVIDSEEEDASTDSGDMAIPFRNPSPPAAGAWPTRADQGPSHQDRNGRAILDRLRVQAALVTNMLMVARRPFQHPPQLPSLARRVGHNSTIHVVSSSSDEDEDSPRLGATARTPPYLLPSRKRTVEPTIVNSIKRFLLQNRMPSASTSATSSSSMMSSGIVRPVVLGDDIDGEPQGAVSSAPYYSSSNSMTPVVSIEDDVDDGTHGSNELMPSSRHSPASEIVVVDSPNQSTTPYYDGSSPAAEYVPQCGESLPDSSQEFSRTPPALYASPGDVSPYGTAGRSQYSPSDFDLFHRSSRADSRDYSPDSSYYNRESPNYTSASYAPTYGSRDAKPIRMNTMQRPSPTPSPIDPDEVQILAELKPKHLRTPELVTLGEEENGELDQKHYKKLDGTTIKSVGTGNSVLSMRLKTHANNAHDDLPSTSGINRRRPRSRSRSTSTGRSSKRRRHKSSSRKRSHKSHKRDRSRHRDRHDKHRRHDHKKSSSKDKEKKKHHRKEKERRRHDSPSSESDGGGLWSRISIPLEKQ